VKRTLALGERPLASLGEVRETHVLARASTSEVYDQAKVGFAKQGLDGADDAVLAAYLYPAADLQRLLAGEMTGGDDLVAMSELIAVADGHAG
jgi:hypothetical protein